LYTDYHEIISSAPPFGELNVGSAYEDVNNDCWVSVLNVNPIFHELV